MYDASFAKREMTWVPAVISMLITSGVCIILFGAILSDKEKEWKRNNQIEMVKNGFGYYTNNTSGESIFVLNKPCQ